jgi:hypothetical protein
MTSKFLTLQGGPHIYDISRLRVKVTRSSVSSEGLYIYCYRGKQNNYYYEISQDVPAHPSDNGSLKDKVDLLKLKNMRRW